jgi:membrane-bound lytic murein transglycosylase B
MRHAPTTLAALLAAALLACAGARPRPAGGCAAAAERVDALLRAGADDYVASIRRYAAARDPDASTAGSAADARARADAWSRANRPAIEAECVAWTADARACVDRAEAARDLGGCGLERWVRSFTAEVVEPFAARPLDPAPR